MSRNKINFKKKKKLFFYFFFLENINFFFLLKLNIKELNFEPIQ
jgi:hypothetical protein